MVDGALFLLTLLVIVRCLFAVISKKKNVVKLTAASSGFSCVFPPSPLSLRMFSLFFFLPVCHLFCNQILAQRQYFKRKIERKTKELAQQCFTFLSIILLLFFLVGIFFPLFCVFFFVFLSVSARIVHLDIFV